MLRCCLGFCSPSVSPYPAPRSLSPLLLFLVIYFSFLSLLLYAIHLQLCLSGWCYAFI